MRKRGKGVIFGLILVLVLGAVLAFGVGQSDTPTEESTTAVPEGRYKEAPMLAEMVARGELPPVDERLPDEPRVVPPVGLLGDSSLTVPSCAFSSVKR